MKIAIIFPKDSEAVFNKKSVRSFGGATVQMYKIAKELGKRKISENLKLSVFSLINDYPEKNFDDKELFSFVPTFKENDNILKKYLKFKKAVNELKPSVIMQRGLTFFSCLLATYCKMKGIKFIFMFAHDNEVKGEYQYDSKKCSFFKALLKNSSLLVTQSKYQKKTLLEKFNFNSELLKNSIEVNTDFQPIDKGDILWVARCNEWKQPELFLKLAEMNQDYSFKMICTKIINNEDYFHDIKQKAEKLPNVSFKEFVARDEIPYIYSNSKIFVNTSVAEGFPNTFLEAGIHSTPVVSLNSNPDNFLAANNCGFHCNNSIEVMNEKLNTLMKSQQLYETYSKNIYDYVKENHNVKNNVDRLLKIINPNMKF